MINGGGAGRRYLPSAKPNTAINATTIIGRVDANVPNLCPQSSHKLPRSRARQPLRASRSPHSTQKFAACIAGVLARVRALYLIGQPKQHLLLQDSNAAGILNEPQQN